ncbi:MAG: ABC transporter, partial [Pseudomonadota bacterium]
MSSPIMRLIDYARSYHFNLKKATFWSVVNKIFDIFPEILIGVAIDMVVKREESLLASIGITTPIHQLMALGAITLFIWIMESFTEYKALVG